MSEIAHENSQQRDQDFRHALAMINEELVVGIVPETPAAEVVTVVSALHQLLLRYVTAPEGSSIDPQLVKDGLEVVTDTVMQSFGVETLSSQDLQGVQDRANVNVNAYLPEEFPTAEA